MSDERSSKSGELVLATGQFALVLDRTKGNVTVYVGPSKTSLSETDQPIFWDPEDQEFRSCQMWDAIRSFSNAPEGAYVVLTNPAKEQNSYHPKEGSANSLVDLEMGRKVNIHGPSSFALWFQQSAEVVPGHLLRSNQYLVVQVYNDEAAKKNWSQAVIKRQPSKLSDEEDPTILKEKEPPKLSMGQRFIMRGTELSFYMPPTGLEVIKDKEGNYVRDAVSLEQLEYCILLNEDGAKRFVHGPSVVFPSPTETFLETGGRRKFRAIELNPHSGIYVKVIAPYEEDGKNWSAGKEMFITGKDQAIYFPRPEHAIIKYGNQVIHYAVAIPAGEGRYVLNRDTGDVKLVTGPAMLLPDPRTEVIVRRILERRQVELWYPGNNRAIQVNAALLEKSRSSGDSLEVLDFEERTEEASFTLASEEFGRKTTFTPPRTVTLDTKYEGGVEVNVWSGYAILVVSKTGKRQVIQGPKTLLLEFDETLATAELSTGTPKSADDSIKTAYLRVLNNRVSDMVEAETSDLVRVTIKLSHRVNFEGDSSKWFDVENYIQLMCDHTRSLIRNMVKKIGIQEFHENAIDLIRDTILGKVEADKPRLGRLFQENGMRIYDVEVLDIIIGDDDIEELLVQAQHKSVNRSLRMADANQELSVVQEEQRVLRATSREKSETDLLVSDLRCQLINQQTSVEIMKADQDIRIQEMQEKARLDLQHILDDIAKAKLDREKAASEHSISVLKQRQELNIEAQEAAAKALAEKAKSFSPHLIAALEAFGDKELALKVAEAMAPLAILRDQSVAESFVEMVKGTGLENAIGGILNRLKPKTH